MISNIWSKTADIGYSGPVFVNGVWKSGNHLVYSALNALGVEGPFNGIAAHLVFGRNRWLKQLVRRPRGDADAVQVGLETDALISLRYVARQARRLSGRIMGGHAAHTPELEATLRAADARMICIRRDPRDILISFADWIAGRPDFHMFDDFAALSREARVAFLLHGGRTAIGELLPFPAVLERALGWRHAPEVLQVSFEDLVGPSGGGDTAAQAATLEAIHSHVNAPVPLTQVDAAAFYGKSLTFNKGRSGRWRELDDSALIAEIETKLAPQLEQWGYSA